jgi:hypothetical protein
MAVLKNTKNILLNTATTRVLTPGVVLTVNDSINTITVPPGATTPVPSSIVLTATTSLYKTPTYVWEFRYGITGTWTAITGSTNSITVTLNAAWLTAAGSNTSVQYRVTVSETGFTTTTQILTLPIISAAQNGLSLGYSNDSLNVPVSTAGVATWTGSDGILQVFEGGAPLTLATDTLGTTTPATNSRYSLNITKLSGDTLTVPTVSGATTTTATIGVWAGTLTQKTVYRITAYIRTSNGTATTLSTDINIVPTRDAAAYWVVSSAAAIQKTIAGVYTPNSVTYTIYSASGANPPAVYSGRFIISTDDGTGAVDRYTSSVNESTYTYSSIPANTKTIRVRAYLAGGTTNLIDDETLSIVSDGATGAASTVIDLSNDNVTVATNTDGTGGSYTNATTNVTLVSGSSTNVLSSATSVTVTPSTGITFSITRNGVTTSNHTTAQTVTTGLTTLSIAVTALAQAQDNGTLTVAIVLNSVTYTAVFTVSKAKAGVNATVYEVESSGTFNFNPNTSAFSPSSVVFNAYSASGSAVRSSFTSGSIRLQRSDTGAEASWTTVDTVNAGSATLNSTSLTSTTRFVRALLYTAINAGGTLVDTEVSALTVGGTDGAAGAAGAAGTSATVIDLSNDSVTVATNSDGTGGSYTNATSSVTLQTGNTNTLSSATSVTITPSTGVTFSYTRNGVLTSNLTTAQTVTTGLTSLSVAITALAQAQDNGTLTVAIVLNSVTYTAVFTVSKSKAGTDSSVYEVEAGSVFNFNPNTSTFSPTSVVFNAYRIIGNANRSNFSTGSIVLQRSQTGAEGSWTTITTTNGNTATLLSSALATTDRFVRALLYSATGGATGGGTILDTEAQSITVGGSNGAAGASGDKYATVYLYRWAPTTPANPTLNATSNYTWSPPAHSDYSASGDGWAVTPPANPNTPNTYLWVAAKQINAAATATLTQVTWASGTYTVYASTGNGLPGTKTAEAIVYQWATSIPTITGTSNYDWTAEAVDTAPSGWFTTVPDTGTASQTLWAATVSLIESVNVTTTSVNWTTASIQPFGFVGSTGAVGRIAYTETNGYSLVSQPTPSTYTTTVTGDNLPTQNTWHGIHVATATSANITLSGTQTIAGVSVTTGTRVLVKNQTTASQNGVYVGSTGAWTRATDADTWNKLVNLRVVVTGGTQSGIYLSNATAGGTLGTTSISFTATTAVAWTSTPPTAVTNDVIWQSDGIYNPTNDQTIWGVPYKSSLKVGNLSALATNTGSLTVSGNIKVGSYGTIVGGKTIFDSTPDTTFTPGFFLGYSGTNYRFQIGSGTSKYLSYNGTDLTLKGGTITGSIGTFVNSNAPQTSVELGANLDGNAFRLKRNDVCLIPPAYITDWVNTQGSGGAATSFWLSKKWPPQGYFNKSECKVATTANITLSGAQTIDGVAITTSDRVLVKNQTTTSQNGIYIASTGAWTRATNSDAWSDLWDALNGRQIVYINNGNTNFDKSFYFSGATSGTIGTTAITYTELDYGLSTYSGEALLITPDGATGLYVSDTSSKTSFSSSYLVVITGSRKEAQLIVTSKGTVGGFSQHCSRFQHFDTGNTLISSGIAAVTNGLAYYGEVGGISPFTGLHDGLLVKNTQVQVGDILVDDVLINKKDVQNTIYAVKLSTVPNTSAIGIFCSKEDLIYADAPAALIANAYGVEEHDPSTNSTKIKTVLEPVANMNDLINTYWLVNMNSLGEGQVNVCGENGNIQPGDLIVTSNMPGKGMRQNDDIIRSYTVAKAREGAVFTSPGEVKQIACIYLCG